MKYGAIVALIFSVAVVAHPTPRSASPFSAAVERRANQDPQTSLTLDPAVIAPGFKQDGQDQPVAGQVASLTSTNNFINFCLTTKLPITDGQQKKGGSCNPAPMGSVPSVDKMPSSKFVFPKNTDTIEPNKAFTVQMAIKNLQAGNFVNAQKNYYAAPQQLNAQGEIIGHTHIVIENLADGLAQVNPTDPKTFAFFKGVNGAAQNGIVTAAVDKGLPAGAYRMCSINAAMNHQPVLVAVAQRGSTDDCAYFTVKAGGAGGQANGGGAGGQANGGGAPNAGGGGGPNAAANPKKKGAKKQPAAAAASPICTPAAAANTTATDTSTSTVTGTTNGTTAATPTTTA